MRLFQTQDSYPEIWNWRKLVFKSCPLPCFILPVSSSPTGNQQDQMPSSWARGWPNHADFQAAVPQEGQTPSRQGAGAPPAPRRPPSGQGRLGGSGDRVRPALPVLGRRGLPRGRSAPSSSFRGTPRPPRRAGRRGPAGQSRRRSARPAAPRRSRGPRAARPPPAAAPVSPPLLPPLTAALLSLRRPLQRAGRRRAPHLCRAHAVGQLRAAATPLRSAHTRPPPLPGPHRGPWCRRSARPGPAHPPRS